MLVGNKCDLEDKRIISTSVGNLKADEHEIFFLETSAKTKYNIEYAFHEFALLMLKTHLNNEMTINRNTKINLTLETKEGKKKTICCTKF